jgi:hypothetical protein
MSTLEDWIDRANAFAEEVARLTVEAGVDGQVPALDLAMALATLDPSRWQLVRLFRGSSDLGEDVVEEEAKHDAIRAAVEAGEENGLAEGDVFADVRERIGSRIHAIAMEVGGMDEINDEQNVDRMRTIRTVFGQGEWLAAETVSQAVVWKRQGWIFSVVFEGKEYFPRYEFDNLYQPLPVIQDILKAFGPMENSWQIAAWFHFPNGWINEPGPSGPKPVAPKDALDRREDLLNALKKRQASYVA